MVLFARFIFPVLLALTTSATTWPATSHPTTHRTHYVGADRSLKLEVFHPESTFEGFGVDGVEPLLTHQQYPRGIQGGTLDLGGAAVSFLASRLGISEDSVHLNTRAQGQVAHHVFLAQKINGVPVANAVANVAFNKHGKISSFSSSFVEHSSSADINPSVSLDDAIATAEKTLYGTYNGHPPKLEFVVKPCGFAALTHVIQIHNKIAGTWYEAFVDAHNNKVISVTDFVAKAMYRVLPATKKGLDTGFFLDIVDPENLAASPNGWHQEFTTATNATDGNNAIAYKDIEKNTANATAPGLVFDYWDYPAADPTFESNVGAAMTNAFYVVNVFHDFAYLYGFTETTFNFQSNNFGKGGEGQDRLLVSVQDSSDINNAEFWTPPDGQPGQMRLYLFNYTTPRRDSAFQNEMVIHECQHGANNRMTGGGTARCFGTLESGGVAEGFADAVSNALTQNETTSDYLFASGITPAGGRSHPYSTSNVTNPLRYSDLNGMTDVHALGEVLANALHNVYAELVAAFGWSRELTVDPNASEGNVVFLHLLYDALLLQPCPPSFTTARDAWIQADANRYDGANACLLWKVFASKGLGINAKNHIDDTNIPPGLQCVSS
ncbi:Fungalysin metallopeptidase-domain-containing protein [Lactarius akahatsu]|uniref:Extracellular metalloproteinase n=1 Tax=Lactarius akahatsu TaxID=416441 RepID=A0AAD4QAP8_9AGAM|nr:Fungalysin metallopeptidase-domain-containing protein [Lactarius akahatsu]